MGTLVCSACFTEAPALGQATRPLCTTGRTSRPINRCFEPREKRVQYMEKGLACRTGSGTRDLGNRDLEQNLAFNAMRVVEISL